jgi:UDP-glucose 6-dehydrogenase
MSHHSFSTSVEFIDALLKRYEITPPFGLNQKHFDIFVSKKILPVRIKVCEIIQSWIEQYHQEDFVSNPTLVKKVLLFIDQRLLVDFDNLAEKIFTLIQENVYRKAFKKQDIKYPVVLAPATDAELNFYSLR